MWGRNGGTSLKRKAAAVATLVGEGTCVSGDMTFSGGLHVDGMVRGNIIAANGDNLDLLVVGERGDFGVGCGGCAGDGIGRTGPQFSGDRQHLLHTYRNGYGGGCERAINSCI